MKRILTLFALFTCMITSGQVYQKYPAYGGEWNRLWPKINMGIPNDTIAPPNTPAGDMRGYPHIAAKGNDLYLWDTTAKKFNLYSQGATPWGLTDTIRGWIVQAIPDDGLEDSLAFQVAAAYTGKNLYLMPGEYNLNPVQELIFNHKNIIALGGGLVVLKTTRAVGVSYDGNTVNSIMSLQDSCTLDGISFEGTGRSATYTVQQYLQQNGVRIAGSGNIVRNCKFKNLKGAATFLFNGFFSPAWRNQIYNNQIDSCTSGYLNYYVGEYTLFTNNIIYECINGLTEFGNNNTISHNHINWCGTAGYFNTGIGDDHGSVINNNMNHSNNIYFDGLDYGMVVTGNNYWYTNIVATNANRLNISGGSLAEAALIVSGTGSVRTVNFSNNYLHNVTFSVTGTGVLNKSGNTAVSQAFLELKYQSATKVSQILLGDTTLIETETLKILTGTPGAGKVLTSDADGVATWETTAGGRLGVLGEDNLATQTRAFDVDGNDFSIVNGSTELFLLPASASLNSAGVLNLSGADSVVFGAGVGFSNSSKNKAAYIDTTTGRLHWGVAASSGTTWNGITDPTGNQSLDFGAGEKSTWTNNNTTENLLTIGTPTMTTGSHLVLNSTSTALATGNAGIKIAFSGANAGSNVPVNGIDISVANTGTGSANRAIYIDVTGGSFENTAIMTSTGSKYFWRSLNGPYIYDNVGAAKVEFHYDFNHSFDLYGAGMLIYAGGNVKLDIRAAGVYVGGNASANSTFQIGGSFSAAYVEKTGTYGATIDDYTINCTANTFTVTLPTAAGITGRIYNIVNSGAGVITIATTSSQTFVNVVATPTTLTLSAVGSFSLQSTGANWVVL